MAVGLGAAMGGCAGVLAGGVARAGGTGAGGRAGTAALVGMGRAAAGGGVGTGLDTRDALGLPGDMRGGSGTSVGGCGAASDGWRRGDGWRAAGGRREGSGEGVGGAEGAAAACDVAWSAARTALERGTI